MAKLDSGRMSNATRIKQVDDQHRQFETDLGEILGVPDNTPITKPIFGANPEIAGAKPINEDGSITGVPVFKSTAPLNGGGNGIGFEFDDGTTKKRLVLEGTSIKIFKYNTNTSVWDQVCDLDNPTGGSGLLTALSDVNLPPLSEDDAKKILQVNEDGDGFELSAPASIGGITSFTDLDDVSIVPPLVANKIIQVDGTGFLTLQDPPAGVGESWVMMLKADAVDSWATKDQNEKNPGQKPEHMNAAEGWSNTWNWYYPIEGSGVVDDDNLLSPRVIEGTSYLNYYIELEDAGLYRCSVWYEAPSFNLSGIREWRVMPVTATCLNAGAIYTDGHEPPRYYEPNVAGNFLPAGGVHSLGSKDLIVTSGGTIVFQVRQDSTGGIVGATFYASIAKVK